MPRRSEMYTYDHNVAARRQTAAFRVVHRIPDAQAAARVLTGAADARGGGHLLRLSVLLGAVATAVAEDADPTGALLELSTAAHGWIDALAQEAAA
jgi:hypothetical protein